MSNILTIVVQKSPNFMHQIEFQSIFYSLHCSDLPFIIDPTRPVEIARQLIGLPCLHCCQVSTIVQLQACIHWESVQGPVIQATGTVEFEDVLKRGNHSWARKFLRGFLLYLRPMLPLVLRVGWTRCLRVDKSPACCFPCISGINVQIFGVKIKVS